MQKSTLKQTAHSEHLCRYHIVFIPKWRKAVLDPHQFLLARLIKEKVTELGAEILELSIQFDHVHLFIEARPDAVMSKLIGRLKSHLTKQLFEYKPELLQKFPKRSFWARGYFIGTCGVESDIIQRYIQNQ